ncbi:MAG TPA: hypothetical protein VLR91_10730 [Thermodesulfobacteriota bacterium]|nr:hypothetical protein [Thermodesulfobacteriota bacterium]
MGKATSATRARVSSPKGSGLSFAVVSRQTEEIVTLSVSAVNWYD